MKFLIVNTVYPEALTWLYRRYPGLGRASYAEQVTTFSQTIPGATWFYAANLRRLGHTAEILIANNRHAQAAWAREHGLRPPGGAHVVARALRRVRRGVSGRRAPGATADIAQARPWDALVLAQVRDARPDVLVNLSLDGIDPHLMAKIKPYVGLLVGEGDAALPLDRDYAVYDLVRCSLPTHVEHFRPQGLACVLYRFGFEPDVLTRIPVRSRSVPVSWVGSLTRQHTRRVALLEELARHFPLDVRAPTLDHLPADSPLRRCYRGPAWGFDGYGVLSQSAITVNMQIDTAGEFADNIRLYESTGLGALLLTDWKRNLPELFRPGEEVVTYRDAAECVRLVGHFLDHPAERQAIAAAGQARTLRDHTYYQRMQELVDVVIQTRRLRPPLADGTPIHP